MRLILALFVASSAFGADPAPVVFPDQATAPIVPPKPVTPPKPKPPAIPILAKGELYVIDYPGDAIVLASPPGIVKITQSGPKTIYGKFTDSKDFEERTFTGKTVAVVQAVATGRAELIVFPVGVAKEDQIGRKLIDSLVAPQPPPTPPGPKPPTPSVAPIAGDGFKMLIVFEATTAQMLPAGQQAAIYGKATRDYLNSKCAVGSDGKTREWRIYDQDTVMDGESKVWIDAMKRPRTSLPWIVVSDGKTGFEGPLPATETEITKLLTKYGK